MDTLDVIHKAQRLGGEDRRSALIDLIVKARRMGCNMEIGGGRAGGINFRYGSIGYAIMDVNTKGQVKLYVQPHPNQHAPDEVIDALNGVIEGHAGLQPKSFPINSYGHLEHKLEDVPTEDLYDYLTEAVKVIEETYYEPYRQIVAA